MNNKIRIIPSGFDFVDKSWGGIYRGGSYLVVGPRKSGRTLMGLKFALEAAQNNEVCLYFTNMRPKDLMIQAASLNFDIQSYMNSNRIIVVRVGDPEEVYRIPNHDRYLADYFKDIVTVVDQYKPDRIVFDELTPYIGFNNINSLKNAFLNSLEVIEERDITSLFVIGEPATEKAEALVNTIVQYVTGVFYLRKARTKFKNKLFGGTLEIVPNVGHTEGQFEFNYRIEPLKGVTVIEEEKKRTRNGLPKPRPVTKEIKKNKFTDNKHTAGSKFKTPTYSYNDFRLILNNQIALYKSTEQKFNIVVFKLDSMIYQNGLLTDSQFQKSITSSLEKKDKFCFHEDYFYVLQVRSNDDSLNNLISNIVVNLPNQSTEYVQNVSTHIWFNSKTVNDEIKDAETLLLEITSQNNNFVSINTFLE